MAVEIPADWPPSGWRENAPLAHLETITDNAPSGTVPTRWQVANWASTREIKSSALPGQVRHKTGLSIGTAKALLKREGNDYPWKKGLVYELTGQDAQILLAPEGRTEIPTGQFRVAETTGDLTTLGVQVELDEKQVRGADKAPGVLGEQIISHQQIDDIYFDPIWLVEQLAQQMGYGVRAVPGETLSDGSTYTPLLDIPYQGSLVPESPKGVDFTEFVGDEGHFEAMDKGLYAGAPLSWSEDIVALAPRPENNRVYLEYYLKARIPARFTLTMDVIGSFSLLWNGDGVPGLFIIEVETFSEETDSEEVVLRLRSSGSNGTSNDSNTLTLSQPVPEDRPFGIQVEVEVFGDGTVWTSARARLRRSAASGWSGWLDHAFTNSVDVDAPYSAQVEIANSSFADTDGRLARLSVVETSSESQQDALLQTTVGRSGRIHLEPLVGTSISPWLDPDLSVWPTMQAVVEAWQGALVTDVYGDLHVLNRFTLTGVDVGPERVIDAGLRFEDIPWAMNFTDQADRLVVKYRPAEERRWAFPPNHVDIVWELQEVVPIYPGNNEIFFTLDYVYPLDLKLIPFVRKDQPNASAGQLHEWDAWRYNNGTGAHIDPNTDISMRVDRVTSSTWKVFIVNHTAEPFHMVDSTGTPWLKIRSTRYFDQRQEISLERGAASNDARNPLEIDLGHYVQNEDDANALADFIWGRVHQRSWRAATINAIPDYRLDLGDVVELVHNRTSLKSNALVTKVELGGQPGQVTQKIDLVLIPPTWEDFDEVWASDTWVDFDDLWDNYTWQDFDRTPTATTVAEIEEAL